MKPRTKRLIRKFFSPFARIGLKNHNFTIISNNCWGGVVYDIFGMQYLSPTIGLYFFADDYVKFCRNLKYYLGKELVQIDSSKTKHYQILRTQQNFDPICGKIGDVEIVFLHYHSFEEAKEKWNRRKTRVNYSNLFFKFSNQNGFSKQNLDDFNNLSGGGEDFYLQ